MILVAFCHGLRASEVTALQVDAVKDGHLTVQRLKGSMRTVQPLISSENALFDERSAMFDFLRFQKPIKRLFPITRQHFWRLLQRYGVAAGLPARKRHPHVLKHTIAMQIIHSAGIENTRQYLGHRSMNSTGAYLKVSDAEASKAAGAALGGLIPV